MDQQDYRVVESTALVHSIWKHSRHAMCRSAPELPEPALQAHATIVNLPSVPVASGVKNQWHLRLMPPFRVHSFPAWINNIYSLFLFRLKKCLLNLSMPCGLCVIAFLPRFYDKLRWHPSTFSEEGNRKIMQCLAHTPLGNSLKARTNVPREITKSMPLRTNMRTRNIGAVRVYWIKWFT